MDNQDTYYYVVALHEMRVDGHALSFVAMVQGCHVDEACSGHRRFRNHALFLSKGHLPIIEGRIPSELLPPPDVKSIPKHSRRLLCTDVRSLRHMAHDRVLLRWSVRVVTAISLLLSAR